VKYPQAGRQGFQRLRTKLKLALIVGMLIVGILLGIPIGSAGADDAYPSFYADTVLQRAVLLGIDHTIRERYEAADSIFADLNRRFPKSPAGPLFRAAVLQTEMLEHEDGRAWPKLKGFIEDAIDKAEQWKSRAPENPEPRFYQAAAYGYWAVYESHWGGWFAALKRGLKASNRFKEAMELDPAFFDAYAGVGNYLYWKSAKAGFIRWLPFIGDTRQKGIRYLQRAANEGLFATTTARTSLIWIYLDYGFPEKSLEIAREMHEEYRESKIYMWGIGLASYLSYRWRECISTFDSLEVRYITEGPGNYYNLIECAYYKAEAAFHKGDYDRCREECRRAFSYPAPKKTKKRLDDKLERLRKRYEELGKYADRQR
jgi:tetratricopeptide (TPR) repeat protein